MPRPHAHNEDCFSDGEPTCGLIAHDHKKCPVDGNRLICGERYHVHGWTCGIHVLTCGHGEPKGALINLYHTPSPNGFGRKRNPAIARRAS